MNKRITVNCLSIVALLVLSVSNPGSASQRNPNLKEYTIAVKIVSDHFNTHTQWDETANYLNSRAEGMKFNILPVEHDTLSLAITKNLIHFIITDPVDIIKLPERYRLKLLATAIPDETPFVLLVPAHKDILSMGSLAARPLFARSANEYYGWILPASIMLRSTNNSSANDLNVKFVDSIKSVIDGVILNDHAVGILSHTSEHELHKNINLADTPLKIVRPEIDTDNPHWVLAALNSVDRDIIKQVSTDLLELDQDTAALKTANLTYWTLPEDQRTVIKMAQKLNLTGDALKQDITFENLVINRPDFIAATIICGGGMLAWLAYLLIINRKLHLHIKNKGYEATHDKMTRLLNHGAFIEELEKIKHSDGNPNTQYALMYIDLDNFKPINDQCGHDAGDSVLIQVATVLKTNVRECDIIGRLGGDEFAILFSRIQSHDIAMVAKNIIQKVNRVSAVAPRSATKLHVGCSIGIVPFTRSSAKYISLVKKADAAMYRAKQQGKNRYYLSLEV